MSQVPPPAERALRLRLYVAGNAPNSLAALVNLKAALAELPADRIDLEIIDVLQEPERGLVDDVLMTPMLVRHAPHPERRILGNLSAAGALRSVLTIDEPRDE
jgi:circadian clock protein KaiB